MIANLSLLNITAPCVPTQQRLNILNKMKSAVISRSIASLLLAVARFLLLLFSFQCLEFGPVFRTLTLAHSFQIEINLVHRFECRIVLRQSSLGRREVAFQTAKYDLESRIFHVLWSYKAWLML